MGLLCSLEIEPRPKVRLSYYLALFSLSLSLSLSFLILFSFLFFSCFRCIEWMDCCCAGTENNNNQNGNGEEELVLPVSQVIQCRDTICPHPRASSCELLDQLPCSMPLNSGYSIHTYHLHIPNINLFDLSVVLCWTGFIYKHCYQMNPTGYSSPMPPIRPPPMWVAFAKNITILLHTCGSKKLHFFFIPLQETTVTRVLVPFAFGLVELFVAKHV